ncbi:hypothetical protein T492DRAFT_895541 [Pavlovales sp. CCMP2436]|nr:hypothetical protein T492DRAFT_895541 [Pavlovales sp. CCMP2436]
MALNHLHRDGARSEPGGGHPASPPARDDADDVRESLVLIAYVSPVSTSKHAAHGGLRERAESQLRTPVSTPPAGPPSGARKAGKRPLGDDCSDERQTSSPVKHFRGVTERKSSVNSFIARCQLNGIRHHLGSFSTAEGAACAYDTFAFAHGRTELNFEYAPGSEPQLIEQPKQPRTLLVVDAWAEPQHHDSEDVHNNDKRLRGLQSSSTLEIYNEMREQGCDADGKSCINPSCEKFHITTTNPPNLRGRGKHKGANFVFIKGRSSDPKGLKIHLSGNDRKAIEELKDKVDFPRASMAS